MNLGEEHTVAALIKARESLDPARREMTCSYRLQETMLCLYASLDMLIANTAGLTDKEREILRWYMDGYAAEEISELCGTSRQAVSKMMHNAVRKLVRQNAANWKAWATHRFGLPGSEQVAGKRCHEA